MKRGVRHLSLRKRTDDAPLLWDRCRNACNANRSPCVFVLQINAEKTIDIYISLHGSSSDELNFEENECVECLELYQETTSTSDWIQCVGCFRWLHESCTLYENMCCLCGRLKNKLEKQKLK